MNLEQLTYAQKDCAIVSHGYLLLYDYGILVVFFITEVLWKLILKLLSIMFKR